jgi:2-methylcitrate dehydratase PrpD
MLVEKIVETSYEDLSDRVILHGKKSLLNWLGVTIGAIGHKSIDIMLQVVRGLQSAPQATILGRRLKTDLLFATLINGTSSHVFDFDDTHLETIHHPSGPVAPVVFALGETRNLPPRELLRSFILGCEVELRISKAVYPSHYDLGYHITPTAGVFGATAAAGLLLGLDKKRLAMALGIAGSQSAGLREMFGTMTKPFHVGKAAQNGLLAALLAEQGFTSSEQVLEAKRGFANVMAPSHDLSNVLKYWGEVYEFEKNAFKPYACGIVLHPAIDACKKLGRICPPGEVDEIVLRVNPYVLELTCKREPKTGLEGKFSIYHSGAIAFLEQDASEDMYSDEKVKDERIVSFRQKIKPIVDENISEEKAEAMLRKKDGSTYVVKIEHATGSLENPMTQEMLNNKFRKLCLPFIGPDTMDLLIERIMNFEQLESIHEIINLI